MTQNIFKQKDKILIFLDTALPGNKSNFSYLFTDPVKVLCAKDFESIPRLLQDIDKYSKDYWVSGYLGYEAAYALEHRFSKFRKGARHNSLPLAWFGVFKKPHVFKNTLPQIKQSFIHGSSRISHKMDYNIYKNKIHKIKQFISKGQTYQVNFTYDTSVNTTLAPFDFYLELRKNQATKYCAYIQNKYGHIMSFSPELFFAKNGNNIVVKPMKGTAAMNQPEKTLHNKKNKAENIMIVDLLRNDLGKICKTKSVKTMDLFKIENLPTLHQMTSTVSAQLKRGIEPSNIIKGLFPCGSVTGAPKIKTMEIIHELEQGQRGVYCGMLGYFSPAKKAVFNVPIRTLQKAHTAKPWKYRVGSGIVWNSSAKSERNECVTKCRFLQLAKTPPFELFESILWDKKFVYLRDHTARLKNSAKYFGYAFSEKLLQNQINKASKILKNKQKIKVRFFLKKNGHIHWDYSPVHEPKNNKIHISKTPIKDSEYLYHKTTYRPFYEKAMAKIKKGLCYDAIFQNSKGEITEGAISNIFIKKDKMLYTPPIKCGLLPGILRQQLLRNKKCKEKILYPKDLLKADKIYCGNSVRGLKEVVFV